MNQFKFLKLVNFKYHLSIFNLVVKSIQKDIDLLVAKENSDSLTVDEKCDLAFYEKSVDILIESTFLQIYAELEECLYQECDKQLINKKASITRFEPALKEQGYNVASEFWKVLLDISKIRNCLLHGNGRLDADKYGEDTKSTITLLNSDADATLIEIVNLESSREGTAKIKIKEDFLYYCVQKIEAFINSQQ